MGSRRPRGSHGTDSVVFRRCLHRAPAIAAALLALAVAFLVAAGAALAAEIPANTSPPTISGGAKAQEGSPLKAYAGKWTGGSLTYSFQWQRCDPEGECANILLASSSEYTAGAVDVGSTLRVVVTARNSAGSREAASEKTAQVTAVAPKNTELPAISGVAEEGQLLSASTGGWGGTPATTYIYQWEWCTTADHCTAISGSDEASYRVSAANIGDTLRVTVTDENPGGSKSAISPQTAKVTHGPPVSVDFPTITGSLREGGTLEAAPGTWVGVSPIEYAYTWESCDAEDSCTYAAGSSYAVGANDVGRTIRVTVTAQNSLGSATASSVATPRVLGKSEDFAVAWGEDWEGQLGTSYQILEGWEEWPVAVEGVTNITSVAAGGNESLELGSDGTISSSGSGAYGAIGDGARNASWEQGEGHVTVKGISNAVQISAGANNGMALLADGDVEAWGSNQHGALGNGKGGFEQWTGENGLEPKEVKALHGREVVSIASGGGSNFAVLADGELLAWGFNDHGQLGVGWPEACERILTCEPSVKKPMEYLKNEEPIVEPKHKCFMETGWSLCAREPEPVVEREGNPIKEVVSVSSTDENTFALLKDGEVLSWGVDHWDGLGQPGEPGVHTAFTKPAPVMENKTTPLTRVVAIAAGKGDGLALREDGQLVGWGEDSSGALGTSEEKGCTAGKQVFPCDRYATPISGLEGVRIKAFGTSSGGYSVVLGSEGKVYTVGSNAMGELGRGPGCEEGGGEMGLYTSESCHSSRWEAVPGLSGVQAISIGTTHVLALVGAGGAPPPPKVADEPAQQALKLEWQLPDEESAKEVVYRLWESRGEAVGPPECENQSACEEEEPETGTGEAPKNEVLPHVKVIEFYEEEGKRLEKNAVSTAVGDKAKAGTSGTWSGTQPITYEYQWLRCKNSKCSAIVDAVEKEYLISEEDVGYQLELQVTARNGVAPHGVAASETTEIVKAEEAGRKSAAQKIKLSGQDGVLLTTLDEVPLQPIQYEVKLSAAPAVGGKAKTRRMVLVPLP